MFLGRVVGSVWATKKISNVENLRFLVVHPTGLDREPNTDIVVVADVLGAGAGETVLCAYGRAARLAVGNDDISIEAAIIGIVDSVDVADEERDAIRDANAEQRGAETD